MFVLPPFEDNGLLFWAPDDLSQRSEVVCEVCSAFGYSFNEFVGEWVVSPSYSSGILAPPLWPQIFREQTGNKFLKYPVGVPKQ